MSILALHSAILAGGAGGTFHFNAPTPISKVNPIALFVGFAVLSMGAATAFWQTPKVLWLRPKLSETDRMIAEGPMLFQGTDPRRVSQQATTFIRAQNGRVTKTSMDVCTCGTDPITTIMVEVFRPRGLPVSTPTSSKSGTTG